MRSTTIPISWVVEEGHRFDCGPFTRGGIEARKALESSRTAKSRLVELTAGGMAGMYHVGMDKLRWVEGEDHGVPLLRSADVLRADLSNQPYISRAQVKGNPLFTCPAGTTLITRSGTIGRMAYCRSDMARMAMSQDVLKVVPDTHRIASGYLYAFLSSRYGVPLVVSGTFGSIIVHIEAENIADLPVPRFGASFETKVHELVERAASLRVEASRLLEAVGARFDAQVDEVASKQRRETPRVSVVYASLLQRRMDAQFHDPLVGAVRGRLQRGNHTTVGALCNRIFLPGIFKRIHVDDVAYGAPYYTGATLFWLEPQPKGVLSRKTSLFEQVRMDEGTILVQAFGQEGGLTGRAVWVGRHLAGATTTHMLVRLSAPTKDDTAYLFGFLQSDTAYRQIASLTYGGSIPHFDEAGIASVVVPLLPPKERQEISRNVLAAVTNRDKALDAEREARALVEVGIEKGAN